MKIKLFSMHILCIFLILSMSSCDEISYESDTNSFQLVSFFDLRERETFIQLTNTNDDSRNVHVQIFDVDNNCNENDFFDNYTGNDTHVYNMRDILTNDGNPSGIALPDGAYGFVVITTAQEAEDSLIGSFRVLDNNGYEYRTNSLGTSLFDEIISPNSEVTFNFNIQGEVSLSDIIGITFNPESNIPFEVTAADLINSWALVDINILDLNENII